MKYDVSQVAERLRIRRRGDRLYCPFCQPGPVKNYRHPDCAVSQSGLSWHCYKCDSHGDAIDLVRKVRNCGFRQAVDWIEAEGILEASPTPAAQDIGDVREELAHVDQETVQCLAAFYEACRPIDMEQPMEPRTAAHWISSQRFNQDVVKRMGVRYIPADQFTAFAYDVQSRASKAALINARILRSPDGMQGFMVGRQYAQFEFDIVVLPYFVHRNITGLKLRPAGDKDLVERCDLNRFHCLGKCRLYNFDTLQSAADVLICEGETDVLTALGIGFAAVGIPGATQFRPAYVELFRGKTVTLAFDGDGAGSGATRKVGQYFLDSGLPVPRHLNLPKGYDLTRYCLALYEGNGPALGTAVPDRPETGTAATEQHHGSSIVADLVTHPQPERATA